MGKLKILIADDSKIVQQSIKNALSDETFEIEFAGDGEEAVEKCLSGNPDIIMLDLMMPIKSGYVALKEIREKEKDKEVKTTIIIITGRMDKQDILDCAKLGIQGYIIKPVKSSEINDRVLNLHKKHISPA